MQPRHNRCWHCGPRSKSTSPRPIFLTGPHSSTSPLPSTAWGQRLSGQPPHSYDHTAGCSPRRAMWFSAMYALTRCDAAPSAPVPSCSAPCVPLLVRLRMRRGGLTCHDTCRFLTVLSISSSSALDKPLGSYPSAPTTWTARRVDTELRHGPALRGPSADCCSPCAYPVAASPNNLAMVVNAHTRPRGRPNHCVQACP